MTEFKVPFQEMNREVDSQSDQNRGKGHRQDVQVTNRHRGESQRPADSDCEHDHRDQRMAKAAEAQDEDDRDTDKGDDRRQGHIFLRLGHLVGFEKRDSGQSKLDFGMFRFAFGDDLSQAFE